MKTPNRTLGATILLVVVMLTSCSRSTGGEPTAGDSSAPDVNGGASVGVDLTGFDPCTALTPAQASELGVNGPFPSDPTSPVRSCLWDRRGAEPLESYYVEGDTLRSIDQLEPVGPRFKVGRFDAVVGKSALLDFEKTCLINIGVWPQQRLLVSYNYNGSRSMNHSIACKKALPAALMVIETIDGRGK